MNATALASKHTLPSSWLHPVLRKYDMNTIGIALLVLGFVCLLFGLGKKKQVKADKGSVAVGGDNSGTINNIHTNNEKQSSVFWDVWNIVCGIATLAGLYFAVLPLLEK